MSDVIDECSSLDSDVPNNNSDTILRVEISDIGNRFQNILLKYGQPKWPMLWYRPFSKANGQFRPAIFQTLISTAILHISKSVKCRPLLKSVERK